MHSSVRIRLALSRLGVAAFVVAAQSVSGAENAQAKTFIDYLEPAPITCSPLSSATWGVAGVLPRDTCNGIESAKGAGVPPEYYYWDGQIIRAKDGVYHMFMSTWSGTTGFQNWRNSESYHAVSSKGVLGPYERKGYIWSNGSHQGHNTTAAELPDGTYVVVVSEVVPFTIYKSPSLDGPWTACPGTGLIKVPSGVNPGSDAHLDSNVSLTARHDGKFQIVQRHGLIAIADTLCGPYVVQKPTWTYPAANRPQGIDSIYPHRTSLPDPSITNPTYTWEEDPHIWYSGGRYHVLYSGSGDRIGYELSSPDGIHDWRDGGLAFNPRMYEKIFGYEGSTIYNKWYKMERPGVVLENGHVTHVTWSVADVDKDNQIPANSNHGSKIIVVPFDGVAFDNDTGTPGGAGGGGSGSAGGAGTANGGSSSGGAGGRGGSAGALAMGGGGAAATGGQGGVNASSGGAPLGGTVATGGAPGGSSGAGNTGLSGGAPGSGGASSSGGAFASGGASTGAAGARTGGAGPEGSSGSPSVQGGSGGGSSSNPGSPGCSCRVGEPASSRAELGSLGTLLMLAFGGARRRARGRQA